MLLPTRRLLYLSGLFLLSGVLRAADLDAAISANDLEAAETELEQLVSDWRTAREKQPGEESSRELGVTLQALGIIERQAGKPKEALPHLEEAIKLLANADAAARADALEALALTLQDLGEAAAAETHLRQVIELRESLPQENKEPSLSTSRDHLALNLLAQGKYAGADELIRENLARTSPEDTEARARRLGYSGRYLHTMGSHSRAAEAFREALALPFENSELRLSLESQLALAQLRLGKTDEARRGMEKATEDASAFYSAPGDAFRAAPYLNSLGALDLALGNPLQARIAFAEALELLETSLGSDHPSLISPLNNLGCADQAAGNYAEAEKSLRRAASLQAAHLPRLHLRVAETARNLARNAVLSGTPDAAKEIDAATRLGLGLLEELIVHGTEQERLNFLQRLDLVSLPCSTGDASRIADVLIATKARLLDSMLGSQVEHAAKVQHWRQVQSAMKPGTALIDTCRYLTVSPDPEERYGAIILLSEGDPKWVPLGSSEDLQQGLDAFRRRLSWKAAQLAGKTTTPPVLKLRGILRSLHDEFWAPLAREIPDGTKHLAFSPDGALHFLPLPALLDGSMTPLCGNYLQITTVTSARDLCGAPTAHPLSASPWTLLGVSSFPKRQHPPGEDRLLGLLAELDDMPGTADELARLRKLVPKDSTFLNDAAATESALRSLPQAPGVLHLGCHAFFLSGEARSGDPLDFDENAELLFSGGLLLHRAALREPDAPALSPDDDLLFPAEVADLPLQGTRLVTLSSCESGAGTAVSGEGLLGLRRGFALAGAREVLVALWPVSDRSTPEFMERFYQLAIASDRTGQALWQSQREFLSKAKTDDEFEAAVLRYAPFVLSQNEPLATGGEIVVTGKREIPWKMAWVLAPLLVFLAARQAGRRNKSTPEKSPAP